MELSTCRLCAFPHPQRLWATPPLPSFIWPLPPGETTPMRAAGLFLCPTCGHLQLQRPEPGFEAEVYGDTPFNAVDPGAGARRKQRIEVALGTGCFTGRRVLDVGGGVNPFVAVVPEAERWVADLRIEPEVATAVDHAVVGDFLTSPLPEQAFDFALLLHSLEHFDAPAPAVARVARLLAPGGRVGVEVPNLAGVIRRMPYYALFHQHLSLFHPTTLHTLMARHGLELEHLLEEGEVLFALYRKGETHTAPPLQPEAGRTLAEALLRRIEALGNALAALDLPERGLALYGAGGSNALFLANFPWLRQRMDYCFDRDPRKQGRCLAGTTLPVQPPEALQQVRPTRVVFLFSALCRAVALPDGVAGIDVEALLERLPV